MKKIKIFLITILFTFIYYGNAVAGTGEATEYKIQIHKIEMCDSTSTDSVCNNAVTIYDSTAGSGDIDIANTTAGAAAASLGNAGLANFGVNYTYMQITMNRAFTVKGSAADDSGTTCYTKSTLAGSADELGKGTTTAGDVGATTLYAAMVGDEVGDNLTGLQTLADTTGVASQIQSNDEYLQYRQKLAKTFTLVPGNIPSIKIAFGTSAALGATDDMGDACTTVGAAKGLYAAEPDVTVTIE